MPPLGVGLGKEHEQSGVNRSVTEKCYQRSAIKERAIRDRTRRESMNRSNSELAPEIVLLMKLFSGVL